MTMQPISKDEALALLQPERRQELRERAHEVTEKCVANTSSPLLLIETDLTSENICEA